MNILGVVMCFSGLWLISFAAVISPRPKDYYEVRGSGESSGLLVNKTVLIKDPEVGITPLEQEGEGGGEKESTDLVEYRVAGKLDGKWNGTVYRLGNTSVHYPGTSRVGKEDFHHYHANTSWSTVPVVALFFLVAFGCLFLRFVGVFSTLKREHLNEMLFPLQHSSADINAYPYCNGQLIDHNVNFVQFMHALTEPSRRVSPSAAPCLVPGCGCNVRYIPVENQEESGLSSGHLLPVSMIPLVTYQKGADKVTVTWIPYVDHQEDGETEAKNGNSEEVTRPPLKSALVRDKNRRRRHLRVTFRDSSLETICE